LSALLGAPYLPTKKKNLDAMFQQLRNDPHFASLLLKQQGSSKLRFADLGSGDGRIVFRAARENVFGNSCGYEINPLLHSFAQMHRALVPTKYWKTTSFFIADVWNVDLRNVDVVAVVSAQR
jgi:hypothetical protein